MVKEQIEIDNIPYNFVVGIDLGTTNSAIAYVDLTKGDAEKKVIRFLDVPQLRAPGEIDTFPVLPSFLYIPGQHDMPAGSTSLPWNSGRQYVVGEMAREQGALVPGRLVSSAKSWLCHGGVDRSSNILPWGKDVDVEKVSPIEASARYIIHLREAWNEVIGQGRDEYALEEQMVIITVPASFDEIAREFTVKAARMAGLERIKLMEEPLASFYAWLYQHEDTWQDKMSHGQLVLVCDVGGGTTDFTIIAVAEGESGLRFNRLSVGDHLMLGGDNIDLAIARHVEVKLFGKPCQLDTKRWHQLVHQCRKAKEVLLSERTGPESVDITLMGSGGRLIADTLKSTISRDQVKDLIVDGFFPFVPKGEGDAATSRKGLTEWGLPYVQDPRVTGHLSSFWRQSTPVLQGETGRQNPYPDFMLFNGGSLTPSVLRERIQDAAKEWFCKDADDGWRPEELENATPELAVAVGAVNYGLAQLFGGLRVGAGSPRSYYVEVAGASTGVQEDGNLRRSVCVVPRSAEEGFETRIEKPAFEVLANRPVSFQVFTSSTRLGDKVGDIIELPEGEIALLPPINTLLRFGKKGEDRPLPVVISVVLTEIGTLELWCSSQESSHNWQLQFDVRMGVNQQAQPLAAGETLDAVVIKQAMGDIEDVFASKGGADPDLLIKKAVTSLSMNKAGWPVPVIRKLSDALLKCRDGRSFTPRHEGRWLNLLGYCLRPGFGDPMDDWRIRETWKVFLEGICFADKNQCLSEWWIFWRRIAGGLKRGQQMEIYKQLSPQLYSSPNRKRGARRNPRGKAGGVHDELEVWMTLASFERLDVAIKEKLGRQLLAKIRKSAPGHKELWALSRLGSRIPFYGPLDRVVSAGEVSVWINALLSCVEMDGERQGKPAGAVPVVNDAMAHALVQMARVTGDRERDMPQTGSLPEGERSIVPRLVELFDKLPKGEYFKALLTDPESASKRSEQDWIFGETLPPGLKIGE